MTGGYRFRFAVQVVLAADEDVPIAEINYRGPFAYALEENGELVVIVHDVHGGGERRMPLLELMETFEDVAARLASPPSPAASPDLAEQARPSGSATGTPATTQSAEVTPTRPPSPVAGGQAPATSFSAHLASWVDRNEDHLRPLGALRFERTRRVTGDDTATTCVLTLQVGDDGVEILMWDTGEVEFGFGRHDHGTATDEHHDLISSAQLDVLLARFVAQATVLRTVHDDPRLAVFADDGVSFFSSVRAFTGYAEAPDALDGVYTAVYDAAGRRFVVTAPPAWRAARPVSWWARWAWERELRRQYSVLLEPDESFPRSEAAAARAIREGLGGRHRAEALERLDLRELLALESPIL